MDVIMMYDGVVLALEQLEKRHTHSPST